MKKFLRKLRSKRKDDTGTTTEQFEEHTYTISSPRSAEGTHAHPSATSGAQSRSKFTQIPQLASPELDEPPHSDLDAAGQARGTPEPSTRNTTNANDASRNPDLEHIHDIPDAIPKGTSVQIEEQQRADPPSGSTIEEVVKPVPDFSQLNVNPQLRGFMERSAAMAGCQNVDDFIASELSKRSPPCSNCYSWPAHKAPAGTDVKKDDWSKRERV